jgi:hypothetical protein
MPREEDINHLIWWMKHPMNRSRVATRPRGLRSPARARQAWGRLPPPLRGSACPLPMAWSVARNIPRLWKGFPPEFIRTSVQID